MIISWSLTDPNLIPDSYGYTDITGRTQVDPRIVSGERTGVFIAAGQSNWANFSNNPYTATSPKAHNLNAYTGGMYLAKDPMLGAHNGGGSPLAYLADKLIAANKYDRVIIVPVGVGGTYVASWQDGAALNPHLRVAVRRCKALNLPVTALLWHQGETDADGGTSAQDYENSLASAIASTREEGLTAPWMVARVSFPSLIGASVRAAQDWVIANVPGVLAGPDTDTIGSAYRWDGTHFGQTGSGNGTSMHADLWVNAIVAAL